MAYLAAEVRHQREGCTACIFLQCSNLVQGSPVSTIYHGVPVYELANMLGLDAATLGNHEFDSLEIDPGVCARRALCVAVR